MPEQNELYGIDPDARFLWTPRAGRVKLTEGVFRDGEWEILPTYGEAVQDAPVVIIAPLSERAALRIGAARSKKFSALAKAEKAIRAGADATITMDEYLDKSATIFPDDLRIDILKEIIVGFKIKSRRGEIKFSGVWERDGKAISPWLGELFMDVINDVAWSVEDQEHFLSRQGSPQA